MTEDEEEIERRCDFSHHGGAASALENAGVETRRMAGDAFSRGNDKDAETLRKFAVWLEERARVCRTVQAKYEKKFSGGV